MILHFKQLNENTKCYEFYTLPHEHLKLGGLKSTTEDTESTESL